MYGKKPRKGRLRAQVYVMKEPSVLSIQANHCLCVIQNSDGKEKLIYVGYPLRLSPDETRLLRVLLARDPSQADSQGYTPVDTVLQAMRKSVADDMTVEHSAAEHSAAEPSCFFEDFTERREKYSPQQIAILASRINRKAMAIGGRKLVLGRSHHGYRINPYM